MEDVDKFDNIQEMMLFIGTQFSNLYTYGFIHYQLMTIFCFCKNK